MTTAQVVEIPVTTSNSLSKDYSHPDDHTRQTTDTPGFKPFTKIGTIGTLISFLVLGLLRLTCWKKSEDRSKDWEWW